ncbi:hypothetical protein H0H93_009989 [Arthromyces matolae]|nr:hypothetical protein H0H93_009989 [Arthromyces matolae]
MISSTLAILSSATPLPWPHPGSDNDDNYGLNHVYPDPTTIVVAPSVSTVKNDLQRTAQKRPPRRPIISTGAKRKSMEDTEMATTSNNKNDLDLSNEDPTASVPIVYNQLRKRPRKGRKIQFTEDDDAAIEEWVNSMDRTSREAHQKGVEKSKKEAKKKGQDPEEAARRYRRKGWTTFMSKHRERESEGRRIQYTNDDEAAMKIWKEKMTKSRRKKHEVGLDKAWKKAVAEGRDPEKAVDRFNRKGWTTSLGQKGEAGGKTKKDTEDEDNEPAIVEWERGMSKAHRALRQIGIKRITEEEEAAGRDPRAALERDRTRAWKKAMANARRKESSAGVKKAKEKAKKDGDDVEEAKNASESQEDSAEEEKREGSSANAVANLDHSAATTTPPPSPPPVARKSKYSHLDPEDSGKISLDFE